MCTCSLYSMLSSELGSALVSACQTHVDSAELAPAEFASSAGWPNSCVASACGTKLHAATFGAPAGRASVVDEPFFGVVECLLLPQAANAITSVTARASVRM